MELFITIFSLIVAAIVALGLFNSIPEADSALRDEINATLEEAKQGRYPKYAPPKKWEHKCNLDSNGYCKDENCVFGYKEQQV